MPISFAEQYKVSEKIFDSTGVFNAILDVDARVFIDPSLLKITNISEFCNSVEKVKNYFSNIITLLSHSKTENDMYWKRAEGLLTFKELSGTCFGYSKVGTKGNAIGTVLRKTILTTIKELINEGETDPALFELLGVFQENIGCDRISDLLTFILKSEILSYSHRVALLIKAPKIKITHQSKQYCILKNPFSEDGLYLLPKMFMSPLPIAKSFDDIDLICSENQRVRDEINAYIDFGKRKRIKKEEILQLMHKSKTFRNALISAYKNTPAEPYNFEVDNAGEYIWYSATQEYVSRYPLDLSDLVPSTIDDVMTITNKICERFKELIENNGLNDLLFNENKTPKKERAAQLLFYGVADAYCSANDLDLSREINSGRGAVDFKLSKGAKDKIVVEIKLTSNSHLNHGVETQVPIYMEQEKTKQAIYLVIDNGNPKAVKRFLDFYNKLDARDKHKISYRLIECTYKPSASKA